jgi:hypothetical protein
MLKTHRLRLAGPHSGDNTSEDGGYCYKFQWESGCLLGWLFAPIVARGFGALISNRLRPCGSRTRQGRSSQRLGRSLHGPWRR